MAGARSELIWAAQTRRDLIDIWKYFARVASPEIADKILRDIGTAAERLKRHPFSGRMRNEIASGLRSLLVHPHVIIYRVADSGVEISRIIHERRDVVAAFGEDKKS